jgi:phosphate transport system substrate-binding protein
MTAYSRLLLAGALLLPGTSSPPNPHRRWRHLSEPDLRKWFDAYSKQTGVQISCQSIGSGGGIRQFTEGTVDFGATDGPMTESQIAAVNGNVMHVPTVLGAVVVTYNLPMLGDTRLKFDGTLLVDMFMGRVTKWSDKRIAALNPGVKLPDIDLIVVHRSDGSGTTYVFTDFSTSSPASGATRSGTLPRSTGPSGSAVGQRGRDQQVKQVEGAVGYVS